MTKSLDKTMKNKILMGVVGISFLIMNGCSSDFEKGVKHGCYSMGVVAAIALVSMTKSKNIMEKLLCARLKV